MLCSKLHNIVGSSTHVTVVLLHIYGVLSLSGQTSLLAPLGFPQTGVTSQNVRFMNVGLDLCKSKDLERYHLTQHHFSILRSLTYTVSNFEKWCWVRVRTFLPHTPSDRKDLSEGVWGRPSSASLLCNIIIDHASLPAVAS